jgi:hypothetical protein
MILTRRAVEIAMLRAGRKALQAKKYSRKVREIFAITGDLAQRYLEEMNRDRNGKAQGV